MHLKSVMSHTQHTSCLMKICVHQPTSGWGTNNSSVVIFISVHWRLSLEDGTLLAGSRDGDSELLFRLSICDSMCLPKGLDMTGHPIGMGTGHPTGLGTDLDDWWEATTAAVCCSICFCNLSMSSLGKWRESRKGTGMRGIQNKVMKCLT